MKICIVSVFNSPNQGSFQQLKELGDAYSQYGDVYYLDCGTRSPYQRFFNYFFRCCLRFKFNKAFYELKTRRLFKKRYSELRSITMSEIGEMDLFVVGSDEIWDISRGEMRYPIFFGEGLGGKVVSYAPSVGKATLTDYYNEDYSRYVNNIKALSVRDDYSAKLIRECGYKGDIDIVLDPTFLKRKDQYIDNEACSKPAEPYVALYSFQGYFNKIGIEPSCFLEFAEKKGLKLVSSGVWSDFAKSTLSSNPSCFKSPLIFSFPKENVIKRLFKFIAKAVP